MSLDYDLVIIGDTLEASYAALKAVKLKARVALVLGKTETNTYTEIDRFTFNYLTCFDKNWQNLTQWELNNDFVTHLNSYQIKTWTTQVKQDIKEYYSPAILAAAGIDIIMESGEFCRLPQLGFVIKNRTLRSRNYLLAMGSISSIPKIQGLSEVGYLTLETLDLEKLLNDLIIVSQTPIGIELAQSLNQIGKKVTLVVEDSSILPQEDADAIQLIQAQLEAEGIKLLVNCPISQVRKIENKKWLQAGNEALETDEIIFITKPSPNIQGLNLDGVKVQVQPHQIIVNDKLQTTNPQIYACGSIIGGYSLSNLAKYEANIAVKNAIFSPIFQVNYHPLPWHIFTQPILSRVGLTETQARQSYGDDIIVIKQNYKTLAKAQILDETTGFCKIITRRNGIMLGGHIIGNNSDELINIIALAIKNNIKIQQFSQLFPSYTTISEILFQISENWQDKKFQENKSLNNWLETLLFWRRKWN
ncbi:NAD(P)/FAD-dependent oxidoreductase [Crocosphaera sp. XPORK-15E]|uniref:dihydrolipoyl dehydrogenase family protein n=1 Tax=Crocosphaera sp. XPORK-15E TaxID=3110247 RepID=UPI002B202C15|nr:NAD(P)/FAD-dependent oxidoreductase [Crocosphaera sp. XPORK-15E]MEA5534303.1 NAD(P)/FAD-dependent oxidoreductase [Crocosphaera sp. XPORK-15E]